MVLKAQSVCNRFKAFSQEWSISFICIKSSENHFQKIQDCSLFLGILKYNDKQNNILFFPIFS